MSKDIMATPKPIPGDTSESAQEYFASEWPLDSAGFHHRQAARVVAVNAQNETLLVRGHDFSDTSHWWWFTVGGGLQPGENPREGAVREFFEETGYRLVPQDLVGPVLRRHATFDFHSLTCKQDELFFFARIEGKPLMNRKHQTETEKQVLDELKWWKLENLEQEIEQGTVVYPLNFVSLLRDCLNGWNGVTPEISEGTVSRR